MKRPSELIVAVESAMIKSNMRRLAAERRREAPPLIFGHKIEPWIIAVCEWGYGVHKIPAMAIRLAQTEVPVKAKPSQLLVYQAADFVEPTGFKRGAPAWPNEANPKLVGLTNTHQGFRARPQ